MNYINVRHAYRVFSYSYSGAGKKGVVVILAIALSVGTVLGVAGILVAVFRYKRKIRQKITLAGECCIYTACLDFLCILVGVWELGQFYVVV